MNKDMTNEQKIQLLLESDLLQAPANFNDRVLREIERQAPASVTDDNRHKPNEDRSTVILEWWQWLAVAGGSLVGMTQVTRYIFGFWLSAAVG